MVVTYANNLNNLTNWENWQNPSLPSLLQVFLIGGDTSLFHIFSILLKELLWSFRLSVWRINIKTSHRTNLTLGNYKESPPNCLYLVWYNRQSHNALFTHISITRIIQINPSTSLLPGKSMLYKLLGKKALETYRTKISWMSNFYSHML